MKAYRYCLVVATILIVTACDVAVREWKLHFDDGLIVSGAKKSDAIVYSELEWGVSNQSNADRSLPSSLAFEIGETTLSLLSTDMVRLESSGLKRREGNWRDENWYGRFSNGSLWLRYDEQGKLLWMAYKAANLTNVASASTNSIKFMYGGKPVTALPMSEKEVRDYFGVKYRKERVRGLEF